MRFRSIAYKLLTLHVMYSYSFSYGRNLDPLAVYIYWILPCYRRLAVSLCGVIHLIILRKTRSSNGNGKLFR